MGVVFVMSKSKKYESDAERPVTLPQTAFSKHSL
jgi:hypothetical protein